MLSIRQGLILRSGSSFRVVYIRVLLFVYVRGTQGAVVSTSSHPHTLLSFPKLLLKKWFSFSRSLFPVVYPD